MDLGQLWESPEHGSAHHHHPCGWSSGKLSEQQRGMGVSIPQSHGLAGCTLVGPGFLLGNLALHALLLGGGVLCFGCTVYQVVLGTASWT